MTYIGLCIALGVNGLRACRDAWSEDDILHCDGIARQMSRNRFDEISRYLHLPGVGSEERDSFYKVRWFLNHLDTQCRAAWWPHRRIAIDEASPGYTGRFRHVVRTKFKKVSSAIMVICSVDAEYPILVSFILAGDPLFLPVNGLTRNASFVYALAGRLPTKGHHIFCDNLYSFPILYEMVWEAYKHTITGTIRTNFGVPQCLKDNPPTRKDVITLAMKILPHYQRRLFVVAILDARVFYMLTSHSYPFKFVLSGARQLRNRLDVVACYNQYKNGVDVFDQYMSYYNTYRKAVKWWKRLFFWGIDAACLNCYRIFAIFNDKVSRKDFLLVRLI